MQHGVNSMSSPVNGLTICRAPSSRAPAPGANRAGGIATYQTLQHELDTSLFYPANGFHHGNPAGNAAELDASFQYRVLPCVLEAAALIPVVRNPMPGRCATTPSGNSACASISDTGTPIFSNVRTHTSAVH